MTIISGRPTYVIQAKAREPCLYKACSGKERSEAGDAPAAAAGGARQQHVAARLPQHPAHTQNVWPQVWQQPRHYRVAGGAWSIATHHITCAASVALEGSRMKMDGRCHEYYAGTSCSIWCRTTVLTVEAMQGGQECSAACRMVGDFHILGVALAWGAGMQDVAEDKCLRRIGSTAFEDAANISAECCLHLRCAYITL